MRYAYSGVEEKLYSTISAVNKRHNNSASKQDRINFAKKITLSNPKGKVVIQ